MRARRHIIIPLLLFAYITVMAAVFLPRNDFMPTTDKVVILSIAYLLVLVLFFLMKARAKNKDSKR
ncbi:MAG TPA: hypothetical protein IAA99_01985 [Candidatus Avibacteroides faecavium]|nr:hypothetical protein [Candidatus Avibacteroides faecavium]